MNVGNKVKYYREKYDITQEELSSKIGKTKQYISTLEREQSNVNVGLALEITRAFREITKEKKFGLQTINLQLESLFYLKE